MIKVRNTGTLCRMNISRMDILTSLHSIGRFVNLLWAFCWRLQSFFLTLVLHVHPSQSDCCLYLVRVIREKIRRSVQTGGGSSTSIQNYTFMLERAYKRGNSSTSYSAPASWKVPLMFSNQATRYPTFPELNQLTQLKHYDCKSSIFLSILFSVLYGILYLFRAWSWCASWVTDWLWLVSVLFMSSNLWTDHGKIDAQVIFTFQHMILLHFQYTLLILICKDPHFSFARQASFPFYAFRGLCCRKCMPHTSEI